MTLVEGGLIVAGATNLLLGLIVYTRERRARTNQLFLLLGVSVAAWCWGVAAFLTSSNLESALKLANVYYIAALGIAATLLLFVQSWLSHHSIKAGIVRHASAMAAWVAAVIINPSAIVNGFTYNDGGDKIANFNVLGQVIYSAMFLYIFIRALFLLVSRIARARGHKKSQLQYIALGVVSAGTVGVLFNLVLPWFGVYQYVWIGPVSSVFFVGFVGYSIAKHKLFNYQATAARAFAYLAAVSSILGFYILVIFILSSTNLVSTNLSTFQRIVFASVAVFSGFLYQPARRFFDRVTNQLFYRDAYDAQTLIDELNNTLVNNLELDALLNKSAAIIQSHLKTSSCTFYIRETSYFPDRIISTQRKRLSAEDLESMQDQASRLLKSKVHSAEFEPKSENERSLNRLLHRNDIEVLARLVSTLEFEVRGIGLIFIGPKRSGIPYSKQDMKILEIIANELVIAIQNVLRFEEIQQFNVTLQNKIDGATRELKRTNDKLRALDETKDEFISMASHQLRTPLTSVKGYLSMVLEGDAGELNDQQRKLLNQAFTSSQRMVYLISDLLNVSRLRTGKFIIETAPTDLSKVIQGEINQLRETAGARDLTLDYERPDEFPLLKLDETKIRQVIMNFIDNAIYYTPAGGSIVVSLTTTKQTVEFKVTDTGLGVPKKEQHHLFSKFYRAENAKRARPDGTGLGLFMAKKVIIAQGGAIIFKSQEGKGSTFGFSFPRYRLEVEPAEVEA